MLRYTFDSREVEPGMGFIALKGEKSDGRDFIPSALERGAVDIVEGLEALHEKARQRRRSLRAKVVGVTGSAGKTTTKELLRAFLSTVGRTYATEGNFNNHIGLPLTILNCPDDAEFLVLEMGSNHPGEIAALCDIAAPDVGVVTCVGSAHLEFFKSLDGVESVTAGDANQFFLRYHGAREKAGSILSHLMKNDIHVRWFAENETDLENVYLNMTHDAEDKDGKQDGKSESKKEKKSNSKTENKKKEA